MPRPLISARWRLPALGLVTTCAVVTGALGVLLAGRTGTHPDAVVERALAMHTGLAREVGRVLANVGNPIPVTVGMVGVLWFGHARAGRPGLVFAAAAPLAAMATTSLVLKPVVDRTRSGELAFPSGHTTAITSMACAVAVLVLSSPDVRRAWRYSVLGAAALLSLGVAVSMTGRGYHYPSDTVGGLAVGVGVVLAVALVLDRTGVPRAAGAVVEGGSAGGAGGGDADAPTVRLPVPPTARLAPRGRPRPAH